MVTPFVPLFIGGCGYPDPPGYYQFIILITDKLQIRLLCLDKELGNVDFHFEITLYNLISAVHLLCQQYFEEQYSHYHQKLNPRLLSPDRNSVPDQVCRCHL